MTRTKWTSRWSGHIPTELKWNNKIHPTCIFHCSWARSFLPLTPHFLPFLSVWFQYSLFVSFCWKTTIAVVLFDLIFPSNALHENVFSSISFVGKWLRDRKHLCQTDCVWGGVQNARTTFIRCRLLSCRSS